MYTITLTTDFGTRDAYVGEVKGVLHARGAAGSAVDIAHDVAPGDVRGGAWVLGRIWSRFPAGTVHLAIVDPGVGGAREPIAARLGDRWYVGPDNGLITLVRRSHAADEARRIETGIAERPLSDTFHGRDLFAPAAAHLATGGRPQEIGAALDPSSLMEISVPRPARRGNAGHGHVIHVDRFGNLITNLPNEWIGPAPQVQIAGVTISTLARSYDAVRPGELLLSRGSGGTLEIAVRAGRADERLGVTRDEAVLASLSG